MEVILGLIGISFTILFMVLLGLKFPYLKNIILTGGILRILAGCFHYFILKLPDGIIDAVKFENNAWRLAEMPFLEFLNSFKSQNLALSFVWVLSFIYRFLGRSPLLLQSISISIGILCIILVYKLAFLVSINKVKAKQAAAIFAFFPTVILYNVLILREVYIMMFLLLGFIYFVKWQTSQQLSNGLSALLFFSVLYFLHGALLIAAFLFFILLIQYSTSFFLIRLKQQKLLFPNLALILITPVLVGILFFYISSINLPYLGKLTNVFTFSRILFQSEVTNFGGSAYPDWLIPNSLADFFLLIIPRVLYLLFSPFIWDLRAINHLLGFVDGLLYIFIFYWLLMAVLQKKRKQIISTFYIILLPLLITYSWGVGNFGTALRHRVKFIPVFIAISSVYFPKIVLHNKSRRRISNHSGSNNLYFEGGCS